MTDEMSEKMEIIKENPNQVLKESECESKKLKTSSYCSNECKNKALTEKCYLQMRSDDIKDDSNEEKMESVFNLSNDSIDLKAEHEFIDSEECMERALSPIEELRTDAKHWRQFHTSTSTPIPDDTNAFPELNISSISIDSNDSDMLFEQQMTRFQITDEMIDSLTIDSLVVNEMEKSE